MQSLFITANTKGAIPYNHVEHFLLMVLVSNVATMINY